MIRRLFLFLVIVAATAPATATWVTPSDRVATRLNVREYAHADSAVVGKLEKGETAELIGSVPRWYEIRLHTGVVGFVSKAWSDTLSTAPPGDERHRLGAWNIKKLGHGSSKDFTRVAQVIEAHFDMLAVIEVMQKGGTHPGYDSLMAALGSGWTGTITNEPRPNTNEGHAEFYAVIWRDGIARQCTGWTGLRYHQDNDGSATGTGADTFSREPAFGCFELLRDDGTVGFDFVLAAFHATFQSASAINAEVSHIDDVFTAMAAAQPGEPDLLIIGDFNRNPAQLATLTQAADRTSGTGSTLNSTGAITANLYDHLLVHDEAASGELIGNARVLDVRAFATTNEVFFGSMSDHLPIAIEVQCSQDDD